MVQPSCAGGKLLTNVKDKCEAWKKAKTSVSQGTRGVSILLIEDVECQAESDNVSENF